MSLGKLSRDWPAVVCRLAYLCGTSNRTGLTGHTPEPAPSDLRFSRLTFGS